MYEEIIARVSFIYNYCDIYYVIKTVLLINASLKTENTIKNIDSFCNIIYIFYLYEQLCFVGVYVVLCS